MRLRIRDIQICGQSGYCFTDDLHPQIAVYTENGIADKIEICVSHNGCEDWKVVFDAGIYFLYQGAPLMPKTRYQVEVHVWASGLEDQTSAFFDTGFLGEDWEAVWIEPEQKPAMKTPDLQFFQIFVPKFWGELEESQLQPVQKLQREFLLEEVPESAVLYATAHGIYEVRINGMLPDERRLAPEISAYQKRLYYQRYDLASYLKTGVNRLEFRLADGWWSGRIGLVGSSCQYGDTLGLLAQLELQYPDRTEIIPTDHRFRSTESRIRYADLYIGEKWDLTKQAEHVVPCHEKAYGMEQLEAQCIAPIRTVDFLDGTVMRSPAGELLVDFGQVVAGVISAQLRCHGRREITFEHCEVLSREGEFYQNIVGRNKQQMDTLICEDFQGTFEPRFTYHGFRYVRIKGITEEELLSIQACVLQSPLAFYHTFECSNPDLNQLQHNIQASMRGNFISIPTDCPQREKMGWTGDIVTFADTAISNADVRGFLENWLANMRIEQLPSGEIPNYIPNFPVNDQIQRRAQGENTSSAWGDACILVPLTLYERTGDKRVLEENFSMMEGWLRFIERAVSVMPEDYSTFDKKKKERFQYLWHEGHHYGDWLIPSFMDKPDGVHLGMMATAEIISSAFYAVTLRAFIRVLEILGKTEELVQYRTLLEHVKEAVREEYVEEDGHIRGDLQGLYVMILFADIVEGTLRQKAADQLAQLIHRDGDHLNTGFVTTPHLLDVLCENGYTDIAETLMLRDEAPSWLYQVKHGATTIWENWEAVTEDGRITSSSFNHYALGSVGAWMYRYLGGIRHVDLEKKEIFFRPAQLCGLCYASAKQMTPYGTASCSWEVRPDGMHVQIHSPLPFHLETNREILSGDAGDHCYHLPDYVRSVS